MMDNDDLERIADALERIADAITDDDGNSLLEELVYKLEGLRIQAGQISEGVCGPWPQALADAGIGLAPDLSSIESQLDRIADAVEGKEPKPKQPKKCTHRDVDVRGNKAVCRECGKEFDL